jgi:hypothetical protein
METKQTAMQELIQWLKIGWKDEDVDTVIKKAEQLLEMEKEQLINAYEDGDDNGRLVEWGYQNISSEQFYNETYGS